MNYQPNPTSSSPSPLPIIFTFVDSHLAALDDHIEHRNTNFHDISQRLEFGPCDEYVWAPRTKHREAGPRKLDIYASDVLVWLVSHLNDLGHYHVLCLYDREVFYVGIILWSSCADEISGKDLNYRLNLPDEDVRHLLSSTPTSQGIHSLLQFDEVRLFGHCRMSLSSYSFAAAEGLYSSLQSIRGI